MLPLWSSRHAAAVDVLYHHWLFDFDFGSLVDFLQQWYGDEALGHHDKHYDPTTRLVHVAVTKDERSKDYTCTLDHDGAACPFLHPSLHHPRGDHVAVKQFLQTCIHYSP